MLDFPGQARMTEGMIHFEGNELRSGRFHRSLAWVEDQLSKLSSDEERDHLLQPERRAVTWNSSDFSPMKKPVSRGRWVRQPIGGYTMVTIGLWALRGS